MSVKIYNTINRSFQCNRPLLVVGGLECSNNNWQSSTAPKDGVKDVLLDFLSYLVVYLVNGPTRLDNILHIVITSDPILIRAIVFVSHSVLVTILRLSNFL